MKAKLDRLPENRSPVLGPFPPIAKRQSTASKHRAVFWCLYTAAVVVVLGYLIATFIQP